MGWEHVELAGVNPLCRVEKMIVVVLCHFINKKRAASGDTVVWPGMKNPYSHGWLTKSPVQRALTILSCRQIIPARRTLLIDEVAENYDDHLFHPGIAG